MKTKFKKVIIMLAAVAMIMTSALPAFAATSKYGEDKPLTSKQVIKLTVNAGHQHTYIDASNGCRYQLYHSCMDGMIGSTPTNHSSTVTIDGVIYSLCNYRKPGSVCDYASVIKRIGGASTVPKVTKIPLQKISLNKTSATLNVGSASLLAVSYTPSNTTDSKTVAWSSSNTSVATVSGGKITAKKPGSATITAKVGTKTATCKVTVKAPLTSIALNKTSASVTAGNSFNLSVSYSPANTTDSKTVTWSSSNTSVADVSGGKVTAKKAGTARITAKVGTKTASCTVTVKAPAASTSTSTGSSSSSGSTASAGSYKNVSDAYTLLNSFRTNPNNQWYWNTSNSAKITVYGLKGLTRDSALENVAKTRAKEQWTMYYERGMLTHTRPNGTSCFTIYPSGLRAKGENLAWGNSTSSSAINAWAETNCWYANQGHRRNMLSEDFTRVGIACYMKDGKTCWAMCLGG